MFLHDAKHRMSQEMLSCDIAFHADGIYDANENAFFSLRGRTSAAGPKGLNHRLRGYHCLALALAVFI
jgi:hypothetical protein